MKTLSKRKCRISLKGPLKFYHSNDGGSFYDDLMDIGNRDYKMLVASSRVIDVLQNVGSDQYKYFFGSMVDYGGLDVGFTTIRNITVACIVRKDCTIALAACWRLMKLAEENEFRRLCGKRVAILKSNPDF